MPKKKFDNNRTEHSEVNSDTPLASKRFNEDEDDFDEPLDDDFGGFDDLSSVDDDDDF